MLEEYYVNSSLELNAYNAMVMKIFLFRCSREGVKLTACSFYGYIVNILQIFLSRVDICPMCNVNILLEHLSGLAAQANVLTVLMPFVH